MNKSFFEKGKSLHQNHSDAVILSEAGSVISGGIDCGSGSGSGSDAYGKEVR